MKAKSSILTVVLSLFLASGLLAQEKYEYTSICVVSRGNYADGPKAKLCISTAHQYQEVEFETEKANHLLNNSFVLDYLEKMEKDGWELFDTEDGYRKVYYLRKKKN